MKKRSRPSIFSRLILASFCALFFIYCVMVWLIIRNTNASRSVFLESRYSQARAYIDNYERQLSVFYAQESNLVHNQAARKLAYTLYSSNYEKYQLILSLMETVDDISSLSPLIEDVTIHLPAVSIKISSAKGYTEETYLENDNLNQRASADRLRVSKGRLMMQIAYPLTYSLSEDYVPDIIISIYFSEKAIKQSLQIFSDDSGSGAAFIFDQEMAIGNVDEAIVSRFLYFADDKKIDQVKLEQGTYLVDTFAISNYPLNLLLSINNRALNKILMQDILLLTAVTIMAGLVFFVFLVYVRGLILKPLNKMVSAFKELRQGRFDVRIYHLSSNEFNYLFNAYNDTVEELKLSIDKTLEQGRLINAAELAQFQSQINPHFLYNSFFTIGRMAKNEEYDQIYSFVTSLARYYRFVNKTREHIIPLQDEVDHMRNYIAIQQTRFGDVIKVVEENIPEAIAQLPVPKLILQPLIENAYEHGLRDKRDNGLIRISYLRGVGFFDIIIEDNGESSADTIAEATQRFSGSDENEKFHALYNINQRLKLFFHPLSGLMIETSALGGFKVRLHIVIAPDVSIIE